MANNPKASPSPAAKAPYDVHATYRDAQGADNSIQIRRSIPLADMGACINNIVRGIIHDNGYYPYLYDVAFYGNILEKYTDFDLSAGYERIGELVAHQHITAVLREHICEQQLASIGRCVDLMVDFEKQRLAGKSEWSALIQDVRAVVQSLDRQTLQGVLDNVAGLSESGLIDALVRRTAGGNDAGL